MWSSLALMVALLTGCTSQPEVAADAPSVAQATAKKPAKGNKGAKKSKGKTDKGAKGKAAKGKAGKAAPAQPAVGAAGPVVAELKLSQVEDAAKAPAKPAEGAAAEAPAAASVSKTQAELLLSFGEGEEATVVLGKVKGTCTEQESVPVGPEGKQQTPLWTIRCGDGEKHTDLFVLQLGNAIAVIREVPPTTEGGSAKYRPLKRVPLVKDAELQRKG